MTVWMKKTPAPDVDSPYADIPPATYSSAPSMATGKEATRFSSVLTRWQAAGRPLRHGRQVKRQWCWPRAAIPISNNRRLARRHRTVKGKGGESIASKGEVTGIDQRPRSPAERLALVGAGRAKAENVSPMRFISSVVNPCADRSPWRKWL